MLSNDFIDGTWDYYLNSNSSVERLVNELVDSSKPLFSTNELHYMQNPQYLAESVYLKRRNSANDAYSHRMRQMRRYLSSKTLTGKKPFFFHDDLEPTLNSRGAEVSITCIDRHVFPLVMKLVSDCEGDLINYLQAQYDHFGFLSLVRRNSLKKVCWPHEAILKFSNADKPGKLAKEITNAIELKKRLCGEHGPYKFALSEGCLEVDVVTPSAIVSDGRTVVSIQPFVNKPTLEELLYGENDPLVRASLLEAVVELSKKLYSLGVFWGDMGPRNILVARSGCNIQFTLLDFEKTFFYNTHLNCSQIQSHARSHFILEEFGKPCLESELKDSFSSIWRPDEWDLADNGKIFLEPPKREVLELLNGRGNSVPSMGEYNLAELELFRIRFPYFVDDLKVMPSYTGYRVSHVIDRRYDRNVSELLLSALNIEDMHVIVKRLVGLLDDLDCKLIATDLESIAAYGNVDPASEYDSAGKLVEFLEKSEVKANAAEI